MSGTQRLVPEDTRRRQRTAGDPRVSAWVAANAGSGKTWVLSRRVMHLLLAGTDPARILCLTFTKAAAATMSNRVFAELARWAVADDARLAADIAEVTGRVPGAAELGRARRLFAAAIETPGGLKIQTIHAFCERVLQQFPLEADLAGNFEILDEAAERELIAAARAGVLVRAAAQGPDGRLARALAAVIDAAGEAGFLAALDELVGRRDRVDALLADPAVGAVDRLERALAAALGLAPGDSLAAAEAEIPCSPDFSGAYLADLIARLRSSGPNDGKQAARLEAAGCDPDPVRRREAWTSAFFTTDGAPRQVTSFAGKSVRDALPDLAERFGRECARLAALRERAMAHRLVAATMALLALGEAVLADYAAAKRARGALDFDDLIGRTVALLQRSDAAQWVQYKLDRGIDHILVDEAQDTSPRQWRIVRQLSEEFFAGAGRRDGRTVFAVGDEKQSIYSFQGAAPREFALNEHHFRRAATAAGQPFETIALDLSFRSTPDVLAAVDRVFAAAEMRAGVTSDGAWQGHVAARANEPGLIEIWPAELPVRVEEPEDWTAPVDTIGAEAPPLRLARRIADEIARLTAPGFRLEGTGRPVRPRDILVLVRSRGPFVEAMNRVLKERGVPVAGADRLTLTDHIAVEDLIALGRVVLLPEDDLSLAAVLRSPLFGWSDEQLFAVASRRDPRRAALWQELDEAAAEEDAARAAHDDLARWRARADRVPPFEFYAGIRGADRRRRAFLERLGPEADDVVDEFLARALAHDELGAPSLAGFLAALEAAPPEIKRELDERRDEVRVMTVHGAKGLEAPVVFLVDGGARPTNARHEPKLVDIPVGPDGTLPLIAWCPAKALRCRAAAAALDAWRREAEAEYRRLLYVGMTRAADRLYVVAHAGRNGLDEACWHRAIERALAGSPEARERRAPDGTLQAIEWRAAERPPVAPVAAEAAAAAEAPDLPAWLDRPAAPAAGAAPLRPSKAIQEAEAAAGDGPAPYPAASAFEAALAPESPERLRGRVVHKLLETLPAMDPTGRRDAALRFAAKAMPDADAAALAGEVLAVLDDPAFAAVFAPGSRAEVAVAGELAGTDGRRFAVSGQIDRLAVGADEVLILDYKTNRDPPADAAGIPRGYLAQMAVYRRLMGELFPGRRIRAAILWTARPSLAEIPAAAMDEALAALGLG